MSASGEWGQLYLTHEGLGEGRLHNVRKQPSPGAAGLSLGDWLSPGASGSVSVWAPGFLCYWRSKHVM